jgi:hypothetical protein
VPDLKRLEADFGDALVVIGVHSGKYDREHSDQSIRDAIRKYGLQHPVVNDPDFVIWNTFGARAWPTTFLIDPDGKFVGYHEGEGVYDAVQPAIARVIEEFDALGKIDREPIALDLESDGAVSALVSFPSAVLADEAGDRLFIADSGNNRILVSRLDGALQDVIGGEGEGLADGTFEEARFRQPQGLALSEDGASCISPIRVTTSYGRLTWELALLSHRWHRLALTSVPSGKAPAEQQALASPWGCC